MEERSRHKRGDWARIGESWLIHHEEIQQTVAPLHWLFNRAKLPQRNKITIRLAWLFSRRVTFPDPLRGSVELSFGRRGIRRFLGRADTSRASSLETTETSIKKRREKRKKKRTFGKSDKRGEETERAAKISKKIRASVLHLLPSPPSPRNVSR